MVNEDFTNVIWNYILNHVFPAPDYLVVPGYHFTGGFADHAVWKIGTSPRRLILVYEGKRSGGAFHTIHHALQQAVARAHAHSNHSPALVAALGTSFMLADANGTPSTVFVASQNGISELTVSWGAVMQKLGNVRAIYQEWDTERKRLER
ncbi:hypothetical protein QBC34DRAFT_497358 [Podospora aff. communis PSN243]|uniref:Tautomerase cis-CaaD-like domain-containing protein n=1 Tax=Podospora aff. communis PSN243 TaxID=3040156 RepID=A0AAV9GCA3_9PEZI|nr:hypothetical protein QBC34DRAFT_497358 [Podospora aff. communis PSN243]